MKIRGTREFMRVRRKTRMTTENEQKRARVRKRPERVKGAAEKVGQCYLCFTFPPQVMCAMMSRCRWRKHESKTTSTEHNTQTQTCMVSELSIFS